MYLAIKEGKLDIMQWCVDNGFDMDGTLPHAAGKLLQLPRNKLPVPQLCAELVHDPAVSFHPTSAMLLSVLVLSYPDLTIILIALCGTCSALCRPEQSALLCCEAGWCPSSTLNA